MYRLSSDQIQTLVQIVRDEAGDDLTRPDFAEAMLRLFEDIAGFETLPAAQRRKYLSLLWLRYQIACGSQARSGTRRK